MTTDTSPNPIFPLGTIVDTERRIAAVFNRKSGETLAVQAICAVDANAAVSIFTNSIAKGASDWGTPEAAALGFAVPGPIALRLPPILLRDDAKGYEIAWPLDAQGCLWIKDGAVTLVDGPNDHAITAFQAEGDQIYIATGRDADSGTAALWAGTGKGGWSALDAGGVPCGEAEAVTALAIFADHVYAAVENVADGFQLWRAPVKGGDWSNVMTRGAWRYGYSPRISAMSVVGDHLMVGAAGPDSHRVSLGDEHAEVLRVAKDGTWTLMSGQDRFSPDGLISPAFAGGPGTPENAGFNIGGFDATSDGLRLWLKPLGPQTSTVSFMSWSDKDQSWSKGAETACPALPVTNMAEAPDGSVLVAVGTELSTRPVTADDTSLSPQSLISSVAG